MRQYGIRINEEYKFAYFVTPKSGTRSVFFMFNFRYGAKQFYVPSDYAKYYKWSIVRNPWDRAVSAYRDKIKAGYPRLREFWGLSFKDFVRKLYDKNINSQDARVCDGHIRPLHLLMPVSDMDYICRIENFQADFNQLCDNIGMPRRKLPHRNRSGRRRGKRNKRKHYTQCYDDETREMIAQKYAKDIELFGYEFGN